MLKYNYQFECRDMMGLEGCVCVVHYSVSKTVGGNTARLSGSVSLEQPDPSNYIAFESLTEEQVKMWLNIDEAVAERMLDKQLAGMKPVTASRGAPWMNV